MALVYLQSIPGGRWANTPTKDREGILQKAKDRAMQQIMDPRSEFDKARIQLLLPKGEHKTLWEYPQNLLLDGDPK